MAEIEDQGLKQLIVLINEYISNCEIPPSYNPVVEIQTYIKVAESKDALLEFVSKIKAIELNGDDKG